MQPRTARVGFVVPALLAVAFAIGLGWIFRRDDADRRTEPSRPLPTERAHEPSRTEATPPAPHRMEIPSAEGSKAPPPTSSLHDRLGGRGTIHAIAGRLLGVVQRNDVIMANVNLRAVIDKVDARQLHDHVTNFLCKATGGPCQYTGRTMKDSHAHLKITTAEWDAMTDDLAVVLLDMAVPPDEAEELMDLIATFEDDIVTR